MPGRHGPLRRVVSNVAGVRGSASGDDARDRSGREVAELQAQVGYLEQEVSVLRRKLADSPRQVRSLEEGLAQAQASLAAVTGQRARAAVGDRRTRTRSAVAGADVVPYPEVPASGASVQDWTVDLRGVGQREAALRT